jgi:hypothetical protein
MCGMLEIWLQLAPPEIFLASQHDHRHPCTLGGSTLMCRASGLCNGDDRSTSGLVARAPEANPNSYYSYDHQGGAATLLLPGKPSASTDDLTTIVQAWCNSAGNRLCCGDDGPRKRRGPS